MPGPSAVITALSASGLPTHEFTFLGFCHTKRAEKLYSKKLQSLSGQWCFMNPTQNFENFGITRKFCPDKKVCIARELTKFMKNLKLEQPKSF